MASAGKILELLGSADPGVRVSALQCLLRTPGAVENQPILDQLQALSHDADMAVRFWARKVVSTLHLETVLAEGLGKGAPLPGSRSGASDGSHPSGGGSWEPLLRKVETAADSFAAVELLKRLLALREEGSLEPLTRYLRGSQDVVQISYLTKHLGFTWPRESLLPVLMEYLQHADDRVVANTLEGIEAIGTPACVALFAQMLGHRSHRVRANAAKALAKHDGEVAFRVIRQMLEMKDRPNFTTAACHAVKELKNGRFLPALLPLVTDPLIGADALDAIGVIGADQAAGFLDGPETRAQPGIVRERVLAAIEGNIARRRPAVSNPWARLSNDPPGTHLIEIQEQKIYALEPRYSFTDAERRAGEERINAFGLISKLLYRPKKEGITLTYSESRFEPFWHVSCKTVIDYTRSRQIEIPTDAKVVEILAGNRLHQVQNGRAALSLAEHCREEFDTEVFIDAQSGKRVEMSRHLKGPRREIRQTEELMIGDVIVVPAVVKASSIIHSLLADVFKPVVAIDINDERTLIRFLSLYFRPVYAFEFKWEDYNQTAVLEIDGLTGELVAGRAIKQKLAELVSEENLFELGGEAAGLLIPGAELAMKLARVVFRRP